MNEEAKTGKEDRAGKGGGRPAGAGHISFRHAWREIFRETMDDLRQNRLRSALAMLGIAWGVASLIVLTAIGEGMAQGMKSKDELLGKDIIIIWGGTTSLAGPGIRPGKRIYLLYDDYERLKKDAFLVHKISPEISQDELTSRTEISRGTFDVHGIMTDYQEMRSLKIGQGRLFNERDMADAARVCLIGEEVNYQLFNGKARPGDTMIIGGLSFRVVGVLAEKDQNSNYSGPDNRKIFIPYPAMRRDFPPQYSPVGDRLIYNMIAQPVNLEMSEQAELQIRELMAKWKLFDPLDKDALSIWNTGTGAKMTRQIFVSMQLFLGFVAVVTLMLGGIGVMNIMLVSVRSRIKEIGLRKALGATSGNILAMFFTESLLISLGSGLAGLAGALLFANLINRLPMPDFFAGFVVSPLVGWSSLGFLVFVALASAFYPAYNAAQLDPVEALRFEE